MTLLNPLFTTPAMRAVFDDAARVQGMLDFEAALARAEASTGIIPAAAAPAIALRCRADQFDLAALAAATALAGNLAIPLVAALTALVSDDNEDAGRYVHWGATSQDAIDTGLVLQLRRALDLFDDGLSRLDDALAELARRHRDTVMAGRTLMQQAVPITLGLKVAGWLDAVRRHRQRLAETRERALVLQFGGAAGTLASLGDAGLAVEAALAGELGLTLPALPWHSHRDRVAEVATTLGLLVSTLGKIAGDVALLMQTEVAEAAEPSAPGRGGSSAMPHKLNPVAAAAVLAAATRVPGLVATMLSAMVQQHERGLGGWHAEWETLPEICRLAAGALEQVTQVVAGLEVDAARMRANLDPGVFAAGVRMALAVHVGAAEAHEMVERDDPAIRDHLSGSELATLRDPDKAVGLAGELVDRVVTPTTVTPAKAGGQGQAAPTPGQMAPGCPPSRG